MEELTPTIDRPHHSNRRKDTPEKMSTILQRRSNARSRLKKRTRDRNKKYEFVRTFDSGPEDHPQRESIKSADSKTDDWVIVSPNIHAKYSIVSSWIQSVRNLFKF